MNTRRDGHWSRREFLSTTALAGTGAVLGLRSEATAAEAPLETMRLRLVRNAGICLAPQYLAEELLAAEGFTDVRYVRTERAVAIDKALASGEADMTMHLAPLLVQRLDAGDPIVLLGGIHIGCLELFGSERVRTIRDLKGKKIAVAGIGFPQHILISLMLKYVGVDPARDVEWTLHPLPDAIQLLVNGKIDGLMTFPPEGQELRAKKIGHVVVNTATDRPWSQYFCCILAANRGFTRRNPVATKRAMRAILKADQICALEPERVARTIVDRGFTKSYEYALQTMKEVPYGKWREYDSEDTVRFYSLLLHDAGLIKSSPQKIIAQGTDWRFLKELKKELKG